MQRQLPDPSIERDVFTSPTRTCAACRARAPRELLLRFVVSSTEETPARVVVDLDRTRPGRGVNLGPSPVCIERAVKRGVFQRQWRVPVSREGQEILVAETGAAVRERLASYYASAWARGGLYRAASIDAVEPREAKVLWESEELAGIVSAIPPACASNTRIAARIKALTSAVSEFTFTRAGGMKRRPEAPEACEALERCGGGASRGSAKTRRARDFSGPRTSGPDGRNG